MKFRKTLYIGDHIGTGQAAIVENLKSGKISPTVYVILLCEGRLEIVYNYLLFLKPYVNMEWTVIGLAHGKFEAIRIIERIARDALKKGMEANLTAFLRMESEIDSDDGNIDRGKEML